jgi:hypothetical protein
MIHSDEDDEFDRIEHEIKMKGQPYHFDPVFVSVSQRNQVLEEIAKMFDARNNGIGFYEPHEPAQIIRGMKK